MRNSFLSLCTAAIFLAGQPGAHAQAQDAYPSKPVKIVVGYPPGTPVDTIARVIAAKLTERTKQTVFVENRPGAGSSIGASAVVRSPADGYTLYLSSIANTINPSLNKLSFDFAKDLTAVSVVCDVPVLLVVPPSGPASLSALTAAAKKAPGNLAYGSSGTGTATHLFGALFADATSTRLTHVPYKGSSQTVTDLLSGRLQMMFSPAGTVLPHIKAGKLRAIAVSGKHRLDDLPEVPTFSEGGVPGLDFSLWFGLNAPAGTPPSIIAYLNEEVATVLNLPDVKEQLVPQMIYPTSSSSDSFNTFIRQDIDRWERIVKEAGIQPET